MNRRWFRRSGDEPALGGQRALHLSGMEPALSHEFLPLYGRFHVRGLEAPSVVGRRRPLVVLAEWDESITELAHLIGDSNGYDVRCADNGSAALAMARALQPDLLVIGIRLPVLDGLEVIRRVRRDADRLVQRVPVLVMDVRHDKRSVRAAFECGADDYLEMPYELPVMLRSWRRVTGSFLRPSPLTALLNENQVIQQVALFYLVQMQPEGLVAGLGELLWQPDPVVRAMVRWALRKVATDEARAMLGSQPVLPGGGVDG